MKKQIHIRLPFGFCFNFPPRIPEVLAKGLQHLAERQKVKRGS